MDNNPEMKAASLMYAPQASKARRNSAASTGSDSSQMSAEHRKIEVLALQTELNSAKSEVRSLQVRNRELQTRIEDKESLLMDVIEKFKKEREEFRREKANYSARLSIMENRLKEVTGQSEHELIKT